MENHDLGGVICDRPFRIQRLGHFGLSFEDMHKALAFYCDLLGFRISDELHFLQIFPELEKIEGIGETRGFFTRFGNDHHAFVLMPTRVRRAIDPNIAEDMTINQLTWQVGSLREVVDATDWLESHDVAITRRGRDTPGSNWHVYPVDPDGHVIELYYGIEQIGWDGLSKPREMHKFGTHTPPKLPYRPEYREIAEAKADGVDIGSGTVSLESAEPKFDVGGVKLPRPFRIVGIGPVRLFVEDVSASLSFYTEMCGFQLTETITWKGHECHFLRVNTEHHSLALYPIDLRSELGLSPHSTCMSFGVRVNDYRQLRDAISFLSEQGVEIRQLPVALTPGIAWSAFAIDTEGHAIQLYFTMDQIGWDGLPRPRNLAKDIPIKEWPTTIPYSDSMQFGEVFTGPWA
ncbi:MAG: VOC family protein [Gammaproteobacteria bacterium]|nr:VOC family protein [Gammaproteobacteria bacterium]